MKVPFTDLETFAERYAGKKTPTSQYFITIGIFVNKLPSPYRMVPGLPIKPVWLWRRSGEPLPLPPKPPRQSNRPRLPHQ